MCLFIHYFYICSITLVIYLFLVIYILQFSLSAQEYFILSGPGAIYIHVLLLMNRPKYPHK